jgi:choline dehydrogenase
MKYDVIIVGGGSAGSVLATRLSEDSSRSVLLLEAGPNYTDFETIPDAIKYGNAIWPAAFGEDAHVWGYNAIAVPGREEIVLPRGKVIGGSSSVNGQVFYRGVPDDYDEWESLGNDGWSYTDVLPYFRKSENDLKYGMDDFHGNEGPIPVRRYEEEDLLPAPKAFIEACMGEGFQYNPDSNHPDSTGVGPRALNNVDGVRMSTALTYLNIARHRMNLTIRGDVMVRKVLFDGIQAVGLEAESGGDVFSISGEEIVLCGGAINSPQLLMLSGVGPKGHLDSLGLSIVKDVPGVGQNLRDHPSAMVLYESHLDEPEPNSPSLQVGMRFQTSGSDVHNDMQMSPILMTSEHRPAHVDLKEGVSYLGFSVALQKALTSGDISLRSSEPNDHPILNYDYLTHPEDLRRMREAVRLCIKITERSEFEEILKFRVQPGDDELNSDDLLNQWLLSNVSTQHHSSGTCKMGPDNDPMAVVDKDGKIHGMKNIRVVDASIMPDVVRANTNATTIMIAEKISAQMMER